jgi:hypothetical protein
MTHRLLLALCLAIFPCAVFGAESKLCECKAVYSEKTVPLPVAVADNGVKTTSIPVQVKSVTWLFNALETQHGEKLQLLIEKKGEPSRQTKYWGPIPTKNAPINLNQGPAMIDCWAK